MQIKFITALILLFHYFRTTWHYVPTTYIIYIFNARYGSHWVSGITMSDAWPASDRPPLWVVFVREVFYPAGARCSSVVRAFARGAMGHRIDPSWWIHWAISYSSQCPTTGVTKAVVCIILSVGWCILKNPCC